MASGSPLEIGDHCRGKEPGGVSAGRVGKGDARGMDESSAAAKSSLWKDN